MRLTREQLNNIYLVIEGYAPAYKTELRLYGSRVDDNKKGGDIDLLLILEPAQGAEVLFQLKLNILVDLKKLFGNRKIDLSVINKEQLKTDPFFKLIYPGSVLIEKG